jgi:hypothetical protein
MSQISTRNLDGLPDIDVLRRLLQSLAMLDEIMTLGGGFGYFGFDSRWARNQQVGCMADGSGDDLYAYFNTHGCLLKGFAHESVMSPYQSTPKAVWPGVLDDVPPVFDSALKEPAFAMEDTTFAIWRVSGDSKWNCGIIDYPANQYEDGSQELLSILDGQPSSYVEWASEYYETEIDPESVMHIYQHLPLSDGIVKSLNPDASTGKLHNSLVKIGYPSGNAG